MTFDARETSAWDGRPVQVYTFTRQSLVWRYTSADTDVVVGVNTYRAVPISGPDGLELTSEINRSAVKITVPRDNEVAMLYLDTAPSDTVTVIIHTFHDGDGELNFEWSGRVINVEWQGSVAVITAEPGYTGVRRTGLRRMYQRGCPHVLYGPACRANKDTYKLVTTASSIADNVVYAAGVNAHGDGYYSGGFVEWEIAAGVYDRRYITMHVGANLSLAVLPHSMTLGQQISVYPGCDHQLQTCDQSFGNAPNYGGMPWLPTKNPFGNDPIY